MASIPPVDRFHQYVIPYMNVLTILLKSQDFYPFSLSKHRTVGRQWLQLMWINSLGTWLALFLALILFSPHLQARSFQEAQAANRECGQDRRCRLERLKRKSEQRHQRVLQIVDRRAQENMALANDRENSQLPRYRRPWGLDFITATEGFFGGTGRYHFNEHWQLGLNLGLAPISDRVQMLQREIEVILPDPAVSTQIEGIYLSSAGSFSPLAGLGIRFIKGEGVISDSQAPLGGGGGLIGLVTDLANNLAGGATTQSIQQRGELELHLISAKIGIDYQSLSNGFHARLALSYHYPLFGGHRDSASGQNLPTRASAKDWAEQDLTWDIEFSLGWSL